MDTAHSDSYIDFNGPVGRKGGRKHIESARTLHIIAAQKREEKDECEAKYWGQWLMADLANDPFFNPKAQDLQYDNDD